MPGFLKDLLCSTYNACVYYITGILFTPLFIYPQILDWDGLLSLSSGVLNQWQHRSLQGLAVQQPSVEQAPVLLPLFSCLPKPMLDASSSPEAFQSKRCHFSNTLHCYLFKPLSIYRYSHFTSIPVCLHVCIDIVWDHWSSFQIWTSRAQIPIGMLSASGYNSNKWVLLHAFDILYYYEIDMVRSKPVITRKGWSMLRHNSRTSHKHWHSFFCLSPKMDALSALHSNSMCVLGLLFLVVLPREVSRRLGGLYFNSDKVESLL